MIALRVLLGALGVALVGATLFSVLRTFVLPRGVPDLLSRSVFAATRRVFLLRTRRARTYAERDRVMALLAPAGLLLLPIVSLALVCLGYTAVYWALGVPGWAAAFRASGSALLTLGFAAAADPLTTAVGFSEATFGLLLVALLIAYLPTMYAAFSRREAAVTLLSVRAGTPPTPVELFSRLQRIDDRRGLHELWAGWEAWFVELEESHTSLPALAFFRSPQGDRSWITAAGAVLDSAAIFLSTLDMEYDPQAALCLRSGFLALHQVAAFFGIPYNAAPTPEDPISIARGEYDAVCAALAAAQVPLKADPEQAWRDFRGWRVNYDTALLGLAELIMAPYAPWSSDRGLRRQRRRLLHAQRDASRRSA